LSCQFAREVWRSIKGNYKIQLQRRDFMLPRHWIFSFLAKATGVERTVLGVGCCHIWEAPNDVRNNPGHPDPKQVSVNHYVYRHDIQHCYSTRPSNRRETSQAPRWSQPPHGIILVNLDTSLFTDHRQMAMGVVLQDSTKRCIAATSLPLQVLHLLTLLRRGRGYSPVVGVAVAHPND
jgi:hypothetical protein